MYAVTPSHIKFIEYAKKLETHVKNIFLIIFV